MEGGEAVLTETDLKSVAQQILITNRLDSIIRRDIRLINPAKNLYFLPDTINSGNVEIRLFALTVSD